jgi:hypothetical protein
MAGYRPLTVYQGKRYALRPGGAAVAGAKSFLTLRLNDDSTQRLLVGASRALPLLLSTGATATLTVGLNT